jgi:hypothetical protein
MSATPWPRIAASGTYIREDVNHEKCTGKRKAEPLDKGTRRFPVDALVLLRLLAGLTGLCRAAGAFGFSLFLGGFALRV